MKSIIALLTCYTLFLSQAAWAETNTSSGEITVDNEVTKAQTDDGAASALTLSSLSIFASGIIAPMYVTWCSNQPSAWVYAGTAAIYVGSEFVNWSKYKDASDRAMKAFLGQDKDEQINSLTAAEKQTREAANAAKRKAMFAKLAAAGYGAAAIIALMEQLRYWDGNGACAGASKGGISPVGTGGFTIPSAMLINEKEFMTTKNKIAIASDDASAYMLFNQFTRMAMGEKSSSNIANYHETKKLINEIPQLSGLKLGLIVAIEGLHRQLVSNTYAGGFGENQMEKAGIALGLAGSAALIIWQDTVLNLLPEWVEKVSKSGFTRAAIFGAHSVVAMLASGQISDAQKKLNARANQYNQLAQQLRQMGEGTSTTGDGTDMVVSTSESTEVITPETDTAFTEMGETSCFVQTEKNETLADSTCSCKKTNSCKQAQIPKVEFKGFSLPGSMSRTLTGLKQAGNSLYTGKYLEASTNAGSVVNNAAGVGKMQEALLKKINDRLLKEGKKTADYNKAKNNYLKKFNAAVARSLSSMKPSDALAIRSMANGTSGGEKLAESSIATKDASGKIVITPMKDSTSGASAAKGDNSGASDPFGNMNFETAGQSTVATNGSDAAAGSADDGYEYGDKEGEQISDKANISIFVLISNRYIKTAFPRLFSEQK